MGKPHIGEVDYLRVLGLITIVLIHAWGFYLLMPVASPYSRIVQELGINLMRFGRQVFMFITGLVLFYNYSGRQVNIKRFFTRRLQNLVIPYAIWTAVYLLIKRSSQMVTWSGLGGFIALWWQNVLNGNGYSHLYYILVAIQFYLFFPWLVALFRPRRPATTAEIIIGLGLVLYALYYYLFEVQQDLVMAAVTGTPLAGITGWFLLYKDRLLFSYFPYYLLGALAGLHLETWRQWLQSHWEAVLVLLVLATSLVTGQYFYHYRYQGQAWALTISVFKPSIYLYSLAIIAAGFQLAFYLERHGYLRWLVAPLAANSLGIYLLHPAVLFIFNSYFWQYLRLFGFLLVILEPAAAIVISGAISALLGSNRYTRFIIGEAGNLRYNFPWPKLRAHKAALSDYGQKML
ncbi:acyltransferase [Moorella sp. Hama-1]|uniref:acyltransferase n=1 Tax=Moorella sp. Hama-1 TaxID=2138101 RepID=UPI000D65D89A|nr:acyltransferase [Moorella sp. Hama-1]BCV22399.1 acyltransferase 3 [Moorella sp. Hama-1]